ncbi:MAG: tetratricopeptide repeat protein [Spirochaetaceae bacterium]|jgi:tetratricopeptide (TPR) repeat protein|nr:tetratricopeptide repeat protein [Spirochaetaceae bacterium]
MKYRTLLLLLILTLPWVPSLSAQSAGRVMGYYERGRQLQTMQDYFGATEQFQEALLVNPSFGDAWFALGECAYALEDYELSLNYLENAEKYSRANGDIMTMRGFNYIGQQKIFQAETLFRAVLKTYPNSIDARFGLAELDLLHGRISGAEQTYLEALKRQSDNRRILLALALVSANLGKLDVAENYITQAMRYHSGEPQVHYLASYLSLERGDLADAETHARFAITLNENFHRAYELLLLALYRREQYRDVVDICDRQIAQGHHSVSVWQIKALSQAKLGQGAESLATLYQAQSIFPEDELIRSECEKAALKLLPADDPRRRELAAFHVRQAQSYGASFLQYQAQSEYETALRLNPADMDAHRGYAETFRASGFMERYLGELKIVAAQGTPTTAEKDRLEGLESMLADSLDRKWGVDQERLDKKRWKIGVYYRAEKVQLRHEDADRIVADALASLLSGTLNISAVTMGQPVTLYSSAFREARTANLHYFSVLSYEENDRELTLTGTVYSGKTGAEIKKIAVYRTGSNRLSSALLYSANAIRSILPVYGRVIARNSTEVLVDLGRTEGITVGTEFTVIKSGALVPRDAAPGMKYNDADRLGSITVSTVGDGIAAGFFKPAGFYDRLGMQDVAAPLARAPVAPDGNNTPTAAAPGSAPTAGESAALPSAPIFEASVEPMVPITVTDVRSPENPVQRLPAILDLLKSVW